MQIDAVILALLSTIMLAACGSETEANEDNFGTAMARYLDKKGELCLNRYREYPVAVTEIELRLHENARIGTANDMAALEAAGLVKCEAADKGQRCLLTDTAKPFVRAKEATGWGSKGLRKVIQTDLCWGQKVLDEIVKWEGPMKFGDYQEAAVTYTYEVSNVAAWATKPEVQAAFPKVKSILDGAGATESRHAVKLTSRGWEAKGLD